MPFKSTRVKPTPYPFLTFHALRSVQLISSLVVAAITSYFLRELSASNYSLPWTFILLLAVSLLTLLALALTITLHVQRGLNPVINVSLNAALSVLWAVSFALLAWWSARTLTSACALTEWESMAGAAVCRTYKALFSFALLGLMGALGALGLDVHVLRSSGGRGRFMSLAKRGAVEADVDQGMWDAHPNPAALSGARGREGYVLPEEQFGYAETGYAGAGAQTGRSVDGRL